MSERARYTLKGETGDWEIRPSCFLGLQHNLAPNLTTMFLWLMRLCRACCLLSMNFVSNKRYAQGLA